MTRPTEAEVRELLGRAADIFVVMSREGRHAYRPLSRDEIIAVSRLCEDWLLMREAAVEYDAAHKAAQEPDATGYAVRLINSEVALLELACEITGVSQEQLHA